MSKSDREQYVESSTVEGITTIEFFHTHSNSLPSNVLNVLAEEIIRAGEREDSQVIILKSGGQKVFCAGASFDELISIHDEETGLQFFSGFAKVINAMRLCPKFIIARIQGKCVGGGVGLAAASDYAIALESADIKLSELAVGIGPFVVGPAVERKIGKSAFTTLAIDATSWRSGHWAFSNGLFSEIHPSIDLVDERIDKLGKTLSSSSLEAMKELKKVFWQGTDHWDTLLKERAAISGKLILSNFSKKAIELFKAK